MNRINRIRRVSVAVSRVASPIESLESRRLLATLFAYSNADSGAGSLRSVIALANTNDTIDMTQLSGTISLASTITVDKSLTIVGPGADVLAIDGGDVVRLFNQTAGDVSVSGVTLSNGYQIDPNGVFGPEDMPGGAWYGIVSGTNITFDGVEFESNRASDGGAIRFAGDSVTIRNSTFYGNGAYYGGAIWTSGIPLTITNSTFTANESIANGGAIATAGDLTISDSTFVNNVSNDGGAIWYNNVSLSISRTILANNFANSFNNSDNLANPQNTTIVGSNNLIGIDPLVDTFDNHGGPTRTYSLLANSPAIDQGGANDNSLDQRGFERNGPRDIGAFEFNGIDPNANELPVWTTTQLDSAALGVPFSMTIAFTDADVGDTLNIALAGFPDSFSSQDHGDGTATITGMAQMGDVGTHSVTLMAGDGNDTVDQVLSFYIGAPVALVQDRTLYVNGTNVGDDIHVWQRNDNDIRVRRNEKIKDYAVADIDRVKIIGYEDNDTIRVNVRSIPSAMTGDNGNDTIYGGPGEDRLYGGDGDDIIDAGAGKNWVWGGAGNDTLIGGNSTDRLYGGTGDDRFIGRGGIDFLDGGDDTDTAENGDADNRIAIEVLA